MKPPAEHPIDYRQCTWQSDRDALLAVRVAVFVGEQAVPLALEVDDSDPAAAHWLAVDGSGAPLATARLVAGQKIGRLAVLAAWRGRGIAQRLIALAEAEARRLNSRQVTLGAQLQAIGFYAALGYQTTGEPFDDAGIAHIKMVKALP